MLCGTITSLILQMPAFKTRRSATADGTRDTLAYVSHIVSISQVIGCEDRLQNDLYCVEWGVKLYSNQPTMSVKIKWTEQNITQYLLCIHYRHCIYAFCPVLWPSSIRGLATHGRTFSIYLCPLSFWLTFPRGVLFEFFYGYGDWIEIQSLRRPYVQPFSGNINAIRFLVFLVFLFSTF